MATSDSAPSRRVDEQWSESRVVEDRKGELLEHGELHDGLGLGARSNSRRSEPGLPEEPPRAVSNPPSRTPWRTS